MCNNYTRKVILPIDEVLELIGDTKKNVHRVNGIRFGIKSLRLRVFLEKGVDCVHCGATGKFFALERQVNHNFQTHQQGWHLNLYAIDINGDEVLMTIDHILPKSLGGKTNMKNLQPMCSPCNNTKADKIDFDPVAQLDRAPAF